MPRLPDQAQVANGVFGPGVLGKSPPGSKRDLINQIVDHLGEEAALRRLFEVRRVTPSENPAYELASLCLDFFFRARTLALRTRRLDNFDYGCKSNRFALAVEIENLAERAAAFAVLFRGDYQSLYALSVPGEEFPYASTLFRGRRYMLRPFGDPSDGEFEVHIRPPKAT